MAPLTRSKSTGTLKVSEGSQQELATLTKKGPRYIESIAKGDTSKRKLIIENAFRKRYNMEPRPLQVECVLLLVALWNTFLLASTGFGKSKVPEMYLETLLKVDKPIVMVMNPLDALGDNQVFEKTKDGFTAVSLTQKTFNEATCEDILDGKYQFIYLSPEIFLNSGLFTKLYFHPNFQKRLALKVIDEAHLIYCWGLVASGSAKNLSSFKNLQDRGVFRPSYGNLYGRFLATDHAPMLLMSATCRPKAMDAIKKNLRLTKYTLAVRMAELVRPEIRLVRMTMKHPLKYAKDLHRFFGLDKVVSNAELPPTLIYSGTQNGTWETLSAINEARGHPELSLDGMSPLARRYHSATGPDDKIDRAEHFVDLLYSVICCTMALGLGQNWNIVRRVIVMGRTEPSAVAQMIGRCGRDGRPGVGVLLVEEKRGGAGAKNHIKYFDLVKTKDMSDDERMDALALTPVCLRVAMAVDNYVGHIPISFNDEHYIKEEARQKHLRFPECLCSNCEPEKALEFLDQQHHATSTNFTQIILGQMTDPISHDSCCPPSYLKDGPDLKAILTCPDNDMIREMPVFRALTNDLISKFDLLYDQANPEKDFPIRRRVVFNKQDHAWPIAKNADVISQGASLRAILGSEAIDGIFDCILKCISDWQQSYLYQSNLTDIDTMTVERITKAKKKYDQAAKRALANPKRKNTDTGGLESGPPAKSSRTSRSLEQTQSLDNTLSEQAQTSNITSRIITPTDAFETSVDNLPLRYIPQNAAISPLANYSTNMNRANTFVIPNSPTLHRNPTTVSNLHQQELQLTATPVRSNLTEFTAARPNRVVQTTPLMFQTPGPSILTSSQINHSRQESNTTGLSYSAPPISTQQIHHPYRVVQPQPLMFQTPGPSNRAPAYNHTSRYEMNTTGLTYSAPSISNQYDHQPNRIIQPQGWNFQTPAPKNHIRAYNNHHQREMNTTRLTYSAPPIPNQHNHSTPNSTGPSMTTPPYDLLNTSTQSHTAMITQSAPSIAPQRISHWRPPPTFDPKGSASHTSGPPPQI